MISSMTGYGRAEKYKDDFVIEAEIKSLNSRYLDISVKLPKNFSQKEFEIRDLLRSKFSRGKLGLFLAIRKEGMNGKSSFLDMELLQQVVTSLEKIKTTAKLEQPVTLEHLLSMQSLFLTDSILDPEEEFGLVKDVVDEAIANLIEMRKREGKELSDDMLQRLAVIENVTEEIIAENKISINEYFDKITEKAKQLTEEFINDEARYNTELALLTEKYDITEECVRLKSHIKLFQETLKKATDAGRKLNFICQEMNREANTINSKTVSSVISHKGIIIKEELEKIREQVQNIE